MSQYRRIEAPGATLFFTLVTYKRRPILAGANAIALLRAAFRAVMDAHPFTLDAIAILPDHLHALWTLPPGDRDFSLRWSLIKRHFTRAYLVGGGHELGLSSSRLRRGECGVWQRRFWDHVIRDEDDFGQHLDYIHFNAVKHGHARCPHAWPHSSFRTWVEGGAYPQDWLCICHGQAAKPPDFRSIEALAGE